MSVGQFVSFSTYMMQLTWPIIALGWVINIFQRGTASLIRINEIMNEKPEIRTLPAAQGPLRSRARSSSAGSTSPTKDKQVLHDLNLRVPAGSSLAIVGPTGSGKTTLVSLIPRIYDARSRNGSDRRPPDPRVSRSRHCARNIGFVPQETFLFSERIRENIAFGVDAPPMRRFTTPPPQPISPPTSKSFPEGYETMVGERGITLSGGQKQRTAIARALIRNPEF